MPYVVLEAFAAGKPVVATPVDGARELVAMGARGAVVPIGDEDGAARAAAAILADPRPAPPIDTSAWRIERILRDHRTILIEALGARAVPEEAHV
jgi:glycosyltransferase involved in cell wall biosynthesis